MKQKSLLLVLLLTCAVGYSEGGESSGGGDSIAAEFTNTAYSSLRLLKQNPLEGVEFLKIQEAIRTTVVRTKDKLVLGGKEVEAINYPKKGLIELSRSLWEKSRENLRSKVVLVFHEYLAMAGYDDSKYQLSHKLFSKDQKIYSIICDSLRPFSGYLPSWVKSKEVYTRMDCIGEGYLDGKIINKKGEEFFDERDRPFGIVTLGIIRAEKMEITYNLNISIFGLGLQIIPFVFPLDFPDNSTKPYEFSSKAYIIEDPEQAPDSKEVKCTYIRY